MPETAREMGITRMAINARIARGTVSAIQVGRQWIIPASEVKRIKAEKQSITPKNGNDS